MEKTIFGISAFGHDASISVVKGEEILFAGHSERYSKVKNYPFISNGLLDDALSYGYPDEAVYYERPFFKNLRVSMFGGNQKQYQRVFPHIKTKTVSHHESHAALGYYTSKFTRATVVVVDAIGEFKTTSVWHGYGKSLKCVYSDSYPFSFGLFYSAFTKALGLKPNEEEYILMGMAGYGDSKKYFDKINSLFPKYNKQTMNFHYGVDLAKIGINPADKFDVAAAVQKVYENRLIELCMVGHIFTGEKNNLVLAGGCALNATANTRLFELYSNIYISPNPGDAGSSLGAILARQKQHVNFDNPFLGHDIPGDYPVDSIIKNLSTKGIAAVAAGRAEFGPRALGNRSILADPRQSAIKDVVNKYKKREEFRPFGCVVPEEDANKWFHMNGPSPFMKFTIKCRRPDEIPSVVHVDGTSRVQTVTFRQHEGLYGLLRRWGNITGVPVLLNTSLNIKGQPLLNDLKDVHEWNSIHEDLQICTPNNLLGF